jgi:phosphoenolpyruvate carboxykinase (ATP)
MLGKKLEEHAVSVWLVNTGWIGGPYGVGQRMHLEYTRTMITAALSGDLDKVSYITHTIFGVAIPTACPGVPSTLLNPSSTWSDAEAYHAQSCRLAQAFMDNFEQYKHCTSQDIQAGGPRLG